ncbi:MAG: hydroxymethylglutaryl-CoA synthase [Candidatus Thermoplasmatota archaeon]
MAGIVSYGAYVPRYRIEAKEIARIWGADENIGKALGIISKSVPGIDEDVATISVECARIALKKCKLDPQEIGAIYVGSESHPYVVKPTATIVGEAIGASNYATAADYEFACKAGTAAIQTCLGLVNSNMIKYGLAIGSDTSQGAPGDPLEYTASAGGACFVIGKEKVIAEIIHTISFTTDTPDFWRKEGQKYPSHAGRFTGEPAYFKHIIACGKKLFELAGTKPSDYQHAVFHQPNGKFPLRVGKILGFTEEQLKVGLLTPQIGNTYSGSTPIGLCAILDIAKPDDRIFAVSYGSGAGSDGLDIRVTESIEKIDRNPTVEEIIKNTKLIDYATYAKLRGKIQMGE